MTYVVFLFLEKAFWRCGQKKNSNDKKQCTVKYRDNSIIGQTIIIGDTYKGEMVALKIDGCGKEGI